MTAKLYILCLWPGLPALWLRGDWRGLAAAALFSGLMQFVLISTWIWPEWVDPIWRTAGWWTLGIWWFLASCVHAWRLSEELEPTPSPDAEALFREAQAEYLRGHWFETEPILLQLLEHSPGDAEARLLLATVYRRRGRWIDALQSLAQLERLDAAGAWAYEIAAERRLVAASESPGASEADSTAAEEDRESAEDAEAASLPLADGGKKTRSVDEPSQQRRAA
jgi:tetratricopeptide (TPR) repeat protein